MATTCSTDMAAARDAAGDRVPRTKGCSWTRHTLRSEISLMRLWMDSGALPIFLAMSLTAVLVFAITASKPVTEAIIDNGSMAE